MKTNKLFLVNCTDMNNLRLDSYLAVMAPLATSKNMDVLNMSINRVQRPYFWMLPGVPWPPNRSLNVSYSCLPIFRYYLYNIKIHILTINEPVDYMAWAVLILMLGKDILRAIGRSWPPLPIAQVTSLPRSKIKRGKRHIRKKQIHW